MLLDNGRTNVLADGVGRQTLNCIRCQRLPQHLPGLRADRRARIPVGLSGANRRDPDAAAASGWKQAASLPYASSLCGACYEVCPVKINIPEVLVHLRTRAVAQGGFTLEKLAMGAAIRMFDNPRLLETAQKIARVAQRPFTSDGYITGGIGPVRQWTKARDLPAIPSQSFRDWWRTRR